MVHHYLRYFGLTRAPFSIAPDPSFLYLGERHREALANLVWGLNTDGGFVVLTGEVGTGKTTLSRSLLGRVPKNTDIAYVINPRLSTRELLATLCEELGDPPVSDDVRTKRLIDRINQLLLAAHARARRTVLVIDEAQNLQRDVLEQIRLLTNLETNERKLLQVVLIGQPELDVMLRRPDLRQLAQRITARYHLEPLSVSELGQCIRHRLAVAGAQRSPFTWLGILNLYRLSGGIPRIANVIADRALLGAYAMDRDRIGAGIVQYAAREISGRPARRHWPKFATAAGLAAAVAVTVWLTVLDGKSVASGYVAMDDSTEQVTQAAPLMQDSGLPTAAAAESLPARLPERSTRVPSPPQPPETDASPTVAMAWESAADSGRAAFQAIVGRWYVPLEVESGEQTCRQVGRVGLSCLEMETTFDALRAMDLPAVLHLQGSTRYEHVGVLAMTASSLQVAGEDGTLWLSRDDLARRWDGSATLIWQLPPGYRQPLRQGSRGEPVRWLRLQLAEVGHPASGQADEFDASLERAVRAFQAKQGLDDDGIAGPMTWIHLQRLTGTGIPSLASGEGA